MNFSSTQTCPDALPVYASANFYGGPGQPSASAGVVVSFYGNDFVNSSTAQLTTSSSPNVAAVTDVDAVVVSSTEIQVTIPVITAGTYNLKVTAPNGKSTTLEDAITVVETADDEAGLDITAVSPEEIDDAATTVISITGTGFEEGALAMVGGVPVTDLTISATTITGTVLAGAAPGFQNVVVINPDGQIAKLVGGVEVSDNSPVGYTPGGDALTAPTKVTNVQVKNITKHTARVKWHEVTDAVKYMLTLKRGSRTVRTVYVTKTSHKLTGLKTAKKYKIQVWAFGTYLGGKGSKSVVFTTR